MYVPPAFSVHPAVALAFAAARGFGLAIACEAGRPLAAPVPFELIETHGKSPLLRFHLARNNPLAAVAAKGGEWLVSVEGDDAYVSANWYASANQVPTWLYESVQLSGPVKVFADTAGHVASLTARFEQGEAKPWSPAALPPERHEMLLKAIVAVEMRVETIAGKFKLNQHKTDADNVAVARALATQADPGSQAIAGRMIALRPHLLYEKQNQVEHAASHGEGM